jgi:hypothetical protein
MVELKEGSTVQWFSGSTVKNSKLRDRSSKLKAQGSGFNGLMV